MDLLGEVPYSWVADTGEVGHFGEVLQPVAAAADEQEEMAGDRVLLQHPNHQPLQAVVPFSHVGRVRRDEHLCASRDAQHAAVL